MEQKLESLIIESVNTYGKIIAEDELISKIEEDPFTHHYLPNCNIISEQQNIIPDAVVIEYKELKTPYLLEDKQLYLRDFKDHRNLVSGLEYLLNKIRAEKFDSYNLPSAVAYKNNQAFVFFGGETNLGKSTCAISLSKLGFNLYSDESCVIDLKEGRLKGGCRSIALHKKVIKDLINVSSKELEYKKVEIETNEQPKIAALILPHIDYGQTKPIFYQFKEKDYIWHLNRQLSRKIRGVSRVMGDFEYMLPSLDTFELSQRRLSLIKDFAKQIPCFYFQGSPEQLIEIISSRYPELI